MLDIRLASDIVILFIHVFGLALLRRVKCNRCFTAVQRFYLVQLSVAEIAFAVVSILIYLFGTVFPNTDVLRILYVIKVLPVFLPYIGTMLLITVDRLLAVYFNLKYNLIWTLKRAHVAGSLLAVVSLLSIVFYFVLGEKSYRLTCALYVWPVSDALFITVATVTYAYFFKKIKEQRRDLRRKTIHFEKSAPVAMKCRQKQNQNERQQQLNNKVHHKNRLRGLKRLKKNFYTPTILIASFMIFTIFPDVVYFCYKIKNARMDSTLGLGFSIFYRVGLTWNAFVYIFFQQEVRNVIGTMMANGRRGNKHIHNSH